MYAGLPTPEGWKFQTPSAGRWVLQHAAIKMVGYAEAWVSNPISGEVGAAAPSTWLGS